MPEMKMMLHAKKKTESKAKFDSDSILECDVCM